MYALKAYKDLKRNKYRNLFQDAVYAELKRYVAVLRVSLIICGCLFVFGLYVFRIVFAGGYFTDPYKPCIGVLKGEDIIYDGDKTFPAYAIGLAEMDLPDGTEVVLYVHDKLVIKGYLKEYVDPELYGSLGCMLAAIFGFILIWIIICAVSKKSKHFSNMHKYLTEGK